MTESGLEWKVDLRVRQVAHQYFTCPECGWGFDAGPDPDVDVLAKRLVKHEGEHGIGQGKQVPERP